MLEVTVFDSNVLCAVVFLLLCWCVRVYYCVDAYCLENACSATASRRIISSDVWIVNICKYLFTNKNFLKN